jgi:hypothetical protein
MTMWGVLPEEIRNRIKVAEWDNIRNLKDLMIGSRPFPLRYSLRSPSGQQAIEDLVHLQNYVNAWKRFTPGELVEWKEINFRNLTSQRLPTHLVISDVRALITFIGDIAEQQSLHWELVMRPILFHYPKLYATLVTNLVSLNRLTESDGEQIATLLPSLKKDMGKGKYLRALPIQGIDTKFIETNLTLLESLMDTLYDGEIIKTGGLSSWLGYTLKPTNWIAVRPLCEKTKKILGGFDCIRVSEADLINKGLPGCNLLIVENMESGFGLPELANTVAVLGCGKNLSWMNNEWIQSKKVAYWGDIDSWGLHLLDLAKSYFPEVVSLMMDEGTIAAHLNQMVRERKFISPEVLHLNGEERIVLQNLLDHRYPETRLEQEKLHQDFIVNRLHQWLGK